MRRTKLEERSWNIERRQHKPYHHHLAIKLQKLWMYLVREWIAWHWDSRIWGGTKRCSSMILEYTLVSLSMTMPSIIHSRPGSSHM